MDARTAVDRDRVVGRGRRGLRAARLRRARLRGARLRRARLRGCRGGRDRRGGIGRVIATPTHAQRNSDNDRSKRDRTGDSQGALLI
ncbi:pentapeptide repeat-containing protein [Nocardia sp. NPDC051321]|uniref:pentapeptide repeat-containing protein n=1 Tax=Nocardia sp. NPDC051321 TaxID=3364323 RepID=UPI00378D55C5